MKEDAPQRDYPLREVFTAYATSCAPACSPKGGCALAFHAQPIASDRAALAHGLSADPALDQGRCVRGHGSRLAHWPQAVLREIAERNPQPSAAISRSTLKSSPESGQRAGYDGHKRRKGSKVHLAVDTLGQLLAVTVTFANEQERAQVAELAAKFQEATAIQSR
jgi:Transposase DDE domain